MSIYPECLLFQFLSGGICMRIPILTGVKKEGISRWKDSVFLLKMFFLKLLFRNEGHMYANCLFYILPFFFKHFLSQFLSRGIYMNIPILTGVQNGRTSLRKNSHILLKNVLFEAAFIWWGSPVCQMLIQYFDYLS